ncbi:MULTISPECIES: tRNA (uridine(34)/cytosine(34)/5-carboxymethylaminomethyluridine(34)-2'-O)-methyltransferase TrmL [Carboxydocella]|uniref:Putative tRNA (cytidine(34)-2'-O)-methyltransferase n=2 Tax=Carboxydocella TaxID=178898 RepID=A0A1T4SD55_9FIRM|nr:MULTISPECIES: tRNA (uridine(34)/cytosine(34)/5-carboxymethylaminomethyluridine(34)-2'-O)-methyltransferase TrmL [Carboxydocella]AVX21490.1 tRNA (cytidine/uridine-2'-O-)-methyltransferase [Carboxydocella thermautotrophica]AVX31979.1 tRNA (cytidine/uridine-2'-O-)-methyltransferase [Carboxydocella thermautotrophica]SKA26240.1 tRNA (cytidine/uridine-2'-O-)-methyltransferase [Carboxydocella sporoproducens DSM 16521]GAW28184.1 putative tRNA (cytidine(34)-2'-O)-methyltransferase [Carboxydocella sp.
MFNIVLVEPEIPQNTGNIARTCAATGASLHLVHPLGFSVDDRSLKRAGLDYWHLLDVHHYDNLEHFLAVHGGKTLWLATTKGSVWHTEVSYRPGDFLLFGKETKGLPAELLAARPHHRIRLPMREDARSLNLSNAVAVVVYEALRQNNFAGLK